MSKDSEKFPNPDDFLPERYLQDGKLDANASASLRFLFGFGRRYGLSYHLTSSIQDILTLHAGYAQDDTSRRRAFS